MKRNSGMSLIELVVALGVGAVMLGVLGLMASTTFNLSAQSEKISTAGDTFTILRATMNSKTQCTSNLNTTPLTMTTTSSPIQQIMMFDSKGNANAPVLVVNSDDHGLTIQSITLKPIAQVSPSLIVSNLEVTFTKGMAGGTTSQIVRDLPLFTMVSGGKVIECWGMKDQGTIDADQICSVVTNGALDAYDPVKSQCTLSNGTWVKGSMTNASCPAGSTLPPNPDPHYDCSGNLPGSFSDTFPYLPVTYTDGTSDTITRAPFQATIAGGACQCGWATDLSASSLMGATCSILCIKP